MFNCPNLIVSWEFYVESIVSLRTWDDLEAHLAELIFGQCIPVRRAIPAACVTHRDASVHYLVLTLASAASAMEDTWPIADALNQRNLLDLYRASAAVSSDIAMHALLGRDCTTCGQLLTHWIAQTDQYFDVDGLDALTASS